MIPERSQLGGLPYEVAECYGKPHIMAYYLTPSVKSHRPEPLAACFICGRPLGSVHHNPPLSKGRIFLLRTGMGQFALKPALFAVCGSGTTGCHDGFHGGARFKPRWVWDTEEDAEKWWSGWFLSRTGMAPHSPKLYGHGRWEVSDSKTGRTIEYRGDTEGWQARR